jgi:NAD(P)-dependent dehydrogenase (short-subunit alcohol dehydrogenase family)
VVLRISHAQRRVHPIPQITHQNDEMDSLVGKTAVITGAGSGLGRAFARRFAAAGANLVLADIGDGPLAEAVAEATAAGVRAIGVRTDVAQAQDMDHLAAVALSEFERVNLVFNNAGVAGTFLGADRIDVADWEWVIGVNLWGVIHGHRVFLPHLLEHGDGHIINTASMAGHFPAHSAYGASKWAVVAITEGLHNQLAQQGSSIGVSCLCPGWVNTNIDRSVHERPEWVASGPRPEQTDAEVATYEVIRQLIRDGLSPESVADMVHDAVLSKKFWIFPHPEMVAALPSRYEHILDGTNPGSPSII